MSTELTKEFARPGVGTCSVFQALEAPQDSRLPVSLLLGGTADGLGAAFVWKEMCVLEFLREKLWWARREERYSIPRPAAPRNS